jgi:hypothetical protein
LKGAGPLPLAMDIRVGEMHRHREIPRPAGDPGLGSNVATRQLIELEFGEDLDSYRVKPSQASQYPDDPIPRSIVRLGAVGTWARHEDGDVLGFERLPVAFDEPSRGALPAAVTERSTDDDGVVAVEIRYVTPTLQVHRDTTGTQSVGNLRSRMAGVVRLRSAHNEAVPQHPSRDSHLSVRYKAERGKGQTSRIKTPRVITLGTIPGVCREGLSPGLFCLMMNRGSRGTNCPGAVSY